MKKIFLGLSAMALLLSSCQKEANKNPNPNQQSGSTSTSQSRLMASQGVSYNLYGPDGASLSTSYVPDSNAGVCFAKQIDSFEVNVHYFDNEQQFKDFILTQPDDSGEVLQRLRNRDLVLSYPGIEDEMARTESGKEPSEAYSNWIATTFGSPKTTGTGALYQHDCFGGSSYFLAPYPNWGFGGFRNKASSVNFIGVSGLYDGRWWRGRSIWIAQSYIAGSPCPSSGSRAPFWSLGWTLGYNDMAESSL